MLEQPAMKSGGGGLLSTTMDYARFCQMLLDGGTLDGTRIIGRKTLELMASDHLGPNVKLDSHLVPAGHSFGLGFAVRTQQGMAPFAGRSVSSSGAASPGPSSGSIQGKTCSPSSCHRDPVQREYFRTLIRSLVYAAVE